MQVFELKKKEGLKSSVYTIAFVENPAIEIGFVALSENQPIPQIKLAISEEKQMIYTPVLIPEQRINRINEETQEPYQIYFTAETISEVAQDYMIAKLTDQFNSEHQEEARLGNVSVVENWIIEDNTNDKATKLGFNLPNGTWMVGIKINDPAIWGDVKMKKYKGISIEGLFDDFEQKFNKQTTIKMKTENPEKGIIAKLKAIFETKLASVEIEGGGRLYVAGDELAVDMVVFTDEEMSVMAEPGSYIAGDKTITVGEGGVVTEIADTEAADEEMSKEDLSAIGEATLKIAEKQKSIEESK